MDNNPIDQLIFQSTIRIYPPHPDPLCISTPLDPGNIPQSFSNKEVRKQTFNAASHQLQSLANSLTLAGFFHVNNDLTQCFSCHLQISNWSEPYDPWIIHIRESPFCPFIANLVQPSQIFDLLQTYIDNSLIILPTSFISVPNLLLNTALSSNQQSTVIWTQPQPPPSAPTQAPSECPKDQLPMDTLPIDNESIDLSEFDRYIPHNPSPSDPDDDILSIVIDEFQPPLSPKQKNLSTSTIHLHSPVSSTHKRSTNAIFSPRHSNQSTSKTQHKMTTRTLRRRSYAYISKLVPSLAGQLSVILQDPSQFFYHSISPMGPNWIPPNITPTPSHLFRYTLIINYVYSTISSPCHYPDLREVANQEWLHLPPEATKIYHTLYNNHIPPTVPPNNAQYRSPIFRSPKLWFIQIAYITNSDITPQTYNTIFKTLNLTQQSVFKKLSLIHKNVAIIRRTHHFLLQRNFYISYSDNKFSIKTGTDNSNAIEEMVLQPFVDQFKLACQTFRYCYEAHTKRRRSKRHGSSPKN